MKKDDRVVYNDDKGYYGYTLTYGTTLSAPPIQVDDAGKWKNEKLIGLKHTYDNELQEIQNKYDELVKSWIVNERLYTAKCGFNPIVGSEYHLYVNSKGEDFISIISPTEWDMQWIGTYVLDVNGKWKVIKEKAE